jgi:hypothetical protein
VFCYGDDAGSNRVDPALTRTYTFHGV